MDNGLTSVQVALRIRPLEMTNGDQKMLETVRNEPQVFIKGTDKTFTYNYVFDADVTQEQFYETAIKHVVTHLFNGYNVTILAYGQTGSGKTYTMGTNYDDMGVIQRAIADIFEKIQTDEENDYQVTVAFVELYQELLYDLLAGKPRDQCVVDIREDPQGGIRITNLTELLVTDVMEIGAYLKQGSLMRATGATAMNATSSRSHAIITISIQQTGKDSNIRSVKLSKFHLVDLAGSERPKKTKATGQRFKEGVKINQGLLALGNVISALGDDTQKNTYISYRDSKLTRLLQDSLGGNSITLMIACVSSSSYNIDETVSTLRYADRARKIKNKPIVNEDPQVAEIHRLHKQLKELQDNTGTASFLELEELRAENNLLRVRIDQLDHIATSNDSEREKTLTALKELKEEWVETLAPKMTDDAVEDIQSFENKLDALVNELSNVKALEFEDLSIYITDQESHMKQQHELRNQLNELTQALVIHEHQASQIAADNNASIENRINDLIKERDELLQQLKNTTPQKKNNYRLNELENKIHELNRKIREQERLIRSKERNDMKINELKTEISNIKQTKIKLMRVMRQETEKFRLWKIEREREVCRLRNKDRKLQSEMLRMESMHFKQQNVLKRKFEEAAAINKRLKDALALQKINQDRRIHNSENKTERIHNWIQQELETLVEVVEAEKTLSDLMEQNEVLRQQRDLYSNDIDEEIDWRDKQINNIRQKIVDAEQENRAKIKWDTIQTVTDAKVALKFLFDLASESRRREILYLTNTKTEVLHYREKYIEAERKLNECNLKHEQAISDLERSYEEKMFNLIQKMYDKGGEPISDELEENSENAEDGEKDELSGEER